MNIFDNNKTFWKRIKPLFSEKQSVLQKNITIVEHGIVTSNKKEVAAVENLDIEWFVIGNNDCAFPDNIEEIVTYYETHPSVLKTKQSVRITCKVEFIDTTSEDIKNEILQLDPAKASIGNNITATIRKRSKEVVSAYLADIYNNSKNDTKYPLKLYPYIFINIFPLYLDRKGYSTMFNNKA